MDSLIHYERRRRAERRPARRACARIGAVHLRAAHAAAGADARGRAILPAQRPLAGDRPGGGGKLRDGIGAEPASRLARRPHAAHHQRGFYTSQAMELIPRMSSPTPGDHPTHAAWLYDAAADAAVRGCGDEELPLPRLLRLSLFQVRSAWPWCCSTAR
jgi:hypothetical protein